MIQFPLPMQLPWFHGVKLVLLEQGVSSKLLSLEAIPPWIFMTELPRKILFCHLHSGAPTRQASATEGVVVGARGPENAR